MRLSAQIRSHKPHASDMVFASVPMIFSVVSSLKTVSWVKRQKKNCSSLASSNQSLAFSECTWRFHRSASQTLASRKFNMFIDLFVGHIDLRALRNDKGKLHFLSTRPLTFQ